MINSHITLQIEKLLSCISVKHAMLVWVHADRSFMISKLDLQAIYIFRHIQEIHRWLCKLLEKVDIHYLFSIILTLLSSI
jgi:hypothetical protein